MDRRRLAGFFSRWQFAFLVSLALHAGVLCLGLGTRLGGGKGGGGFAPAIDTRAGDARMEVTFAFVEDPPRKSRPAQAKAIAHPLAAPLKVPQVIESPARQQAAASRSGLPANSGATEEQEPMPASLPGGGTGAGLGKGTDLGTTSFFQIGTQARRVVYVIDHSASMGLNGSFARAKRELLASLERLPADAYFQVIVYNRSSELLSLGSGSSLAAASPESKRRAADTLERLQPEGGTDYIPALKRALALQPDVIFFLTDGDDLRLDQIQTITQINRGRTVIHAVELSGPRPSHGASRLEVLARANQGSYRFVPLER
jgi:hypothetical protein